MAIVRIEGQEYQIDDAIANGGRTIEESDRMLRDALRPNFEIAAGATFQRVYTLTINPPAQGT